MAGKVLLTFNTFLSDISTSYRIKRSIEMQINMYVLTSQIDVKRAVKHLPFQKHQHDGFVVYLNYSRHYFWPTLVWQHLFLACI